MIGRLAASCPAPYASRSPRQGTETPTAVKAHARQAQSNTQLDRPQPNTPMARRQPNRTTVNCSTIRSTSAPISPWGRPVRRRHSRTEPETARAKRCSWRKTAASTAVSASTPTVTQTRS